MLLTVKKKKSLPMLGLMFLLLACIPREEPLERLTLEPIGTLPDVLSENSGMTESGGLIWFINDSDNDPVIYGYNVAQNVVERTVIVEGAVNIDWEDISQNGDHIYIGDFGNNKTGNRTDLRIYIIDKSDLLTDVDRVTPSGIISYSYNDQTDFTPLVENTARYDCEAFFATEDSLFLFTKDWQTLQTRIYSLSSAPGLKIAKFRKQWNVSGLITAVAWSSEDQKLYLLGYTPFIPFLWTYSGFSPDALSYTEVDRTNFSNFFGAQTEGILISEDGSILVSCEESSAQSATLYRIELEK